MCICVVLYLELSTGVLQLFVLVHFFCFFFPSSFWLLIPVSSTPVCRLTEHAVTEDRTCLSIALLMHAFTVSANSELMKSGLFLMLKNNLETFMQRIFSFHVQH